MGLLEIIYIILVSRITDLLFEMLKDAYRSTVYNPSDIMKSIEISYEIKEELENLDGVDRVMLFEAHSSGSYLKPPIKVSSIWGNSENIRDWRDEFIVDKEYVRVLKEIMNNSPYVFKVSKEKDSLLKSIYKKEGIEKSDIHFLKHKYKGRTILGYVFRRKKKQQGFYYMSIANKDGKEFPNETDLKIRENIEKLKSILTYE